MPWSAVLSPVLLPVHVSEVVVVGGVSISGSVTSERCGRPRSTSGVSLVNVRVLGKVGLKHRQFQVVLLSCRGIAEHTVCLVDLNGYPDGAFCKGLRKRF